MCLPGRGCAGCSHARPARSPSQAWPSRAVPAAPGSGDSDTAPSPWLSFGASQHKPPAQNVRPPHPAFCSGGSFSSSSSNSAKAQILQWGGGSGWRGGWARTRIFQGGRNGNTQNEMNLPPVREGSLGGGASPATRGSITTVFLPAPYCSHFARIRNLAQRKETGAKHFGWLPAILSHRATEGSRCV